VTGPSPRRLSVAERERTGRRDRTPVEHGAAEQGEPSLLERQREARPWLDHLVRAGGRYTDNRGDYFAAGITYYTVLALVPIVMVAFAAFGFVLAGNQDLLTQVQDKVATSAPDTLKPIVSDLVTTAVERKGSVGIIGLVLALYSGLGWMSNIREALTAQWEQHEDEQGFLARKGVDLAALVGLFVALVVSVGLSTIGGTGTAFVLDLVNLEAVPGAFLVTRVIAIVLSVATSWLIFTWVISKLPREPVPTRSAVRAALLAALVFEVFKQFGGLYFRSVTANPAFTLFGPVLGILVLVFFFSRVLIFSTAWAATTRESLEQAPVPVPGPAVVTTQVRVGGGAGPAGALAVLGLGVAAVLGISRRRR
jgi:membrane protein